VPWNHDLVIQAKVLDPTTIPTMDALRCLGFQPDPTAIAYDGPVLSFDFGNLKLRASPCRKVLAEIVLFTGVLRTPGSLDDVYFEMPWLIESIKKCAAWVVWNLDQFSEFREIRHVAWVGEARKNQRLLPWVMSMAEWKARPQCMVRRDWLRLALRTLGECLASLPDDAGVVFRFDGSVLSIRCGKQVIALPVEGSPWAVRFRVEAKALRRLPKRLIREDIAVSIWESRITLGNWVYAGTLEEFGAINSSRVH
jgi:hypothetical protein